MMLSDTHGVPAGGLGSPRSYSLGVSFLFPLGPWINMTGQKLFTDTQSLGVANILKMEKVGLVYH